MNPYFYKQLIYDKRGKNIQWGKDENWTQHTRDSNWTTFSHQIKK